MYYMIGMQYNKRYVYQVFYYMYLSQDGSLVSAIKIFFYIFVLGEEGMGYRYMVKYL